MIYTYPLCVTYVVNLYYKTKFVWVENISSSQTNVTMSRI